jgi:hypothetical protein
MNDPQDDHPGADDFEDGPVIAEQKVVVGRAEELVLRYEEATHWRTFQGSDLLFPRHRIKAVAASGLSWAM